MIEILESIRRPWAMEPVAAESLPDVIRTRVASSSSLVTKEAAALGDADPDSGLSMRVQDGTAIIPVRGIIDRRESFFSRFFGDSSVDAIRRDVRRAVSDPSVARILLDVDSPGGSANGVAELADEIRAVDKPVIAYTDGLMASSAYWIAAAADTVIAGPSAAVGSIGVYALIGDFSAMFEREGIKYTLVKAGEHKGAGHPATPVTDSELAVIQDEINDVYGLFVGAVGRFRNLTHEQSVSVADGRVWIASRALEKGLVDRIAGRHEMETSTTDFNGDNTMSTKIEEQPKATAEVPVEPAPATDSPATTASAAETPAATTAVAPSEDAVAAAVSAERERIAGLASLEADYPEFEALIADCRTEGTALADTERLVLAADRKLRRTKLEALREGGTSALSTTNAEVLQEQDLSAEALGAQWDDDPKLQAQHSDKSWFITWSQVEQDLKKQQPAGV